MRRRSQALFALLALQVRAYPSGPGPAGGKKANGLRVGLHLVAGRLEAVLQNEGQKDVVLNVGVMLANGARQYPSAVRVVAIDAKGREHNLVIQPALVAGRLDPLVVPLRAGARYIVPLDLGAAVVQDKGTRLAPGRYRVRVAYKGARVPKTAVPDMPGMALMNYWEGMVRSAAVEYLHGAGGGSVEYLPAVGFWGADSKREKADHRRVMTRDEWIKVWLEHVGVDRSRHSDHRNKAGVPEIDFKRRMVLAIFRGRMKNSAGVRVVSITESADRIVVRLGDRAYSSEEPGRDVTPYGFFVLRRSSKLLVLEENVQSRRGKRGLRGGEPIWKVRAHFSPVDVTRPAKDD